MNTTKKIIVCLILLVCAGCNSGKPGKTDLEDVQTVTVSLQPSVSSLYFSGTITPIQTYSVNSSVDGTVAEKKFEYGAEVKRGQPLLVIHSSQLADDYQTSLTGYLKAKKDYLNNLTQMQGIDYLKKLGIISENEYLNSQSSNYDLELSYNQAARKLESTLAKMDVPVGDLLALHIEDSTAVHKALAQRADILKISSPGTGIILVPSKSSSGSSGSSDDSSILTVGSQVKSGQPLFAIGDSTGIAIVIKVSEININDVKEGQTATITSDAFPGITLKGKVEQVVQQAAPSDSGGSPVFPVNIVVPKLTEAQLNTIHMGMSAKVALQIQTPPTIKVPISAVTTENGTTVVKVLNEKDKSISTVPVVTGATTIDSVEIQQGLKPGDKVVTNAPSN